MASALAVLPKLSATASTAIGWRHDSTPEQLTTTLPNFSCPRGRITEIAGAVSTGRTTMAHRVLAAASSRGEYCAVVDPMNAFDPQTAADSGVDLDTLVWVRCSGNLESAMKSADLLVHSGGFGVIFLDLCELPARQLQRIPLSWWYRFRLAIENTSTILLVTGEEPQAKACAALSLNLTLSTAQFGRNLFAEARFQRVQRKPLSPHTLPWTAEAVSASVVAAG